MERSEAPCNVRGSAPDGEQAADSVNYYKHNKQESLFKQIFFFNEIHKTDVFLLLIQCSQIAQKFLRLVRKSFSELHLCICHRLDQQQNSAHVAKYIPV